MDQVNVTFRSFSKTYRDVEHEAEWSCGTWVDKATKTYICTHCHDIWIAVDRTPESGRMNFCPVCGYKMRYNKNG